MGVHCKQFANCSAGVAADGFTLPPYVVPVRLRSAVSLMDTFFHVAALAASAAWNQASCSGVEMSSVLDESFCTLGTVMVDEPVARGLARPVSMVADAVVRSACFA